MAAPPTNRMLRDLARTAAAAAGGAGASYAAYALLAEQAKVARRVIPHRTDNGPLADGIYLPGGGPVQRVTRTDRGDVHLMIFGDSTAAGLGATVPDETPGVRLARGVASETGLRVRLSTKAIVGATSKGLSGQVDAMLVAGPPPDVAVIFIGANDVTASNGIRASATRLGSAVARLRTANAFVVVGTCPDLGVVAAIPQPLRWFIRRWGLTLAARQKAAVLAAGGRPVPMADALARQFRETPERMFSADNFHPSAAGYELAVNLVQPEVLAALGEWDGPLPTPPQVSAVAQSRTVAARARRFVGLPTRRTRT